MNICVYGASSNQIDKDFIKAGELLGEEIAKRGHTLVFGAGANGIMGAAARGATRCGGKTIGVAPLFFSADGILFEDTTELIRTSNMRERKKILEDLSDAFIMAPGGIGTFDEFFEVLTLKQLARHQKAIAILNTNGYYDDIHKLMKTLVNGNFMREDSLNLYKMLASPTEVLDYIEGYRPEITSAERMKHLGISK